MLLFIKRLIASSSEQNPIIMDSKSKFSSMPLECDVDKETLGEDGQSLEWFGVLSDFKNSNEFFNLNIWPVFHI